MKYKEKYYWQSSKFFNSSYPDKIKKFIEANEKLFFFKFPNNILNKNLIQTISKKMVKFCFLYGFLVFFDMEYIKVYFNNYIFEIEFIKNKIGFYICKLSKKHSFLISLGSIEEFLQIKQILI